MGLYRGIPLFYWLPAYIQHKLQTPKSPGAGSSPPNSPLGPYFTRPLQLSHRSSVLTFTELGVRTNSELRSNFQLPYLILQSPIHSNTKWGNKGNTPSCLDWCEPTKRDTVLRLATNTYHSEHFHLGFTTFGCQPELTYRTTQPLSKPDFHGHLLGGWPLGLCLSITNTSNNP